MALEFIKFESPKDEYGTIKATVHRTGRLGFSSGATKFMSLRENARYKVGFNKDDSWDSSLYIVPTSDSDEEGFKLFKAGAYFYLKLKSVFDKNEIDYKKKAMIYDIEKEKYNELIYFKLKKRVKKERNEKNQSTL
jgi:hypothetical protein